MPQADYLRDVNKPRRCRNSRCLEMLEPGAGWALCPSCRFIGRWCFWIGALLAGAAVKLLG